MVLKMSPIYLALLCFLPTISAIWDNLHQHHLKVTPPPQLKRRSSTDLNGDVIEIDDGFVNAVTPKSFSEIFLGSPDTSTNLVLVKKPPPPPHPSPDFVPLISTEENVHLTPKTVQNHDVMFVTPNSIERPTPTTLRPAPSAAPTIVVLSRDRYIHRPDNDFLLVTPPPKPTTTTIRTTTTRPAIVSSTAGVPASGDIPKSWSIASYDPRKKEEWSVNRKYDFSDNHFSPTTRTPRTFVTPKTENNRMHQPATTSEAIIERLRKDYKKRQEFIEKMQSHRSNDILVTPAPNVISRGSDTTTAASTTTTTSWIPPKNIESNEPYTKGPSIRFMEQTNQQDPAEDRSFYVTPQPSHQYQNSIVPGASTTYQEISTNPPIVLGETHFQLVESYPTTSTSPKPTTSYLTPPPQPTKPANAYTTTTVTAKPFKAIIPLSTSTTTYPPLTSKVFAYQLPTSLTPPIVDEYENDPVATTQTSVVTTAGAIILPKHNLGRHGGGEQYSPPGYVAPTVILLQPQPSIQRNAPDNVTTPPPPQQDIVNATTTDPGQRLTYNATKEPVIKMIDDEITERLQGSGEVNVSLNDTHLAQKGGEVQQSINLKINVYVENDSDEAAEKESYEEPLDSLPKASTVPSIQSEQWKEAPAMADVDVSDMLQALMLDAAEDTKAAPLTYTSSNSFRQPSKAVKQITMPSPATPDDYLYDSELTIDDDFYYYEDDFPEVQLTRSEKNLKEVDLTDLELFELYDDLSDIIVEVEAALEKKVPDRYTTTTTPRPSLAPQRIYNYIASKPLKKRPRPRQPQQVSSIVTPFSREELLEPVENVKRPPPPSMKKKRRPRRRRPANMVIDNSLTPRRYKYGSQSSPDDFYKLTKDLIPDLQDVAKPLNWNVRDFSQWEKLLSSPPVEPLPRRREPKEVEGDVTFDKLLQRDPRKLRPKFSRLIGHDAYRRQSYDYGDYDNVYKLSKRTGQVEDISRETAFNSLPTFDISFEDWLLESGVRPGSRGGGYFHHRPESYFYRRR